MFDPIAAWEPWPFDRPDQGMCSGPDSTVCDPDDVADLPRTFTLLGFGS